MTTIILLILLWTKALTITDDNNLGDEQRTAIILWLAIFWDVCTILITNLFF